MAAAYRITVVERKDLAEVTIVCLNCQTRMILHADRPLVPEQCSACKKMFDDKLQTALNALFRFHRDAGASTSATIEFAVRTQD